MGKNVELYSENELAAMQIKATRRIADALERYVELIEMVHADQIEAAKKKLAGEDVPAEKTKKKTGGKNA